MGADVVDLSLVALIGALVGVAELVARYRDAPLGALKTWPAGLYLVLNALAGFVALLVVRAFGWTFGVEGDAPVRWTQVLTAGFGALALFRSSLFVARVGKDGDEISIGPSSVLRSILDACDRGVDRILAAQRTTDVARIMTGVDFKLAAVALPSHVLALLQNVSENEQTAFAKLIKELIEDTHIDDGTKCLNLGLAIMGLAGTGVLEAAVTSLGDRIRLPEP